MKKSIYSIFVPVLLLALSSCYEDQGNYDYAPISDIAIEGIDTRYTVILPVDTELSIDPEIISGYRESELEYAWVRYNADNTTDTISTERNLRHTIDEKLGSYSIFYYVKVKNGTNADGYYSHAVTNLTVQSEFSKGIYLLKETTDGNTDLDLFLDDDRMGADILARTRGAALSGAPRSLGVMYERQMIDPETNQKSSAHAIGVVTADNKVNVLRSSDMYLAFDHSSMFYNEPNDVPYKFMCGGYGYNFYLSNQGIYGIPIGSDGSGYLGFPGKISGGSEYYGWSITGMGYTYWDNTSDRMIFVSGYTGNVTALNDATYGDFSGLNSKCVFMGACDNGICTILQNKSNNGKKLFVLIPASFTNPPRLSSEAEIATASKLYNATLIASNETSLTRKLLYFVTDNKLYYHDINAGAESAMTATGLPADETITYLRHLHYNVTGFGGNTPYFSHLAIGTYKNGNYKLYLYNMVSDLPEGAPARTTSGTGKLKEAQYIGTEYDSFNYIMAAANPASIKCNYTR